ncbi:MAG: branched-chain amino acid ABC transporter substrate-binding protein [Burkholderiaceae bacterium]|nr:branched-chain amino acid ABC transporter substrate-binding protein [Burkholderiaceae bacterium]
MSVQAQTKPTIKLIYTDPLSGPFAQVGDANLKQWQYVISYINATGGALGRKFELIPFDSKTQPAEALLALKAATDQNAPFLVHCSGSNIAAALIEAVDKHNARNPENRILYINCGAVATELTNEKCSFWHFRFDINVAQKVEVMVRALPKDIKKVYLLNQDYLFGQSVQRDAKIFLQKLRPDIQIVGDELIPLGKVKDFSPYVTKIKAAGAQALISGNWGPDINLLVKAGIESGSDLRYYTMYTHLAGGPTAMGPAADGKVYSVMQFSENLAPQLKNESAEGWTAAFRDANKFEFTSATFRTILEYLQAAITKANSVDPVKIAYALEGLSQKDFLGYDTVMRKDDHQFISEYIVGNFAKGVKYDAEGTGLGWKPDTIVILARI